MIAHPAAAATLGRNLRAVAQITSQSIDKWIMLGPVTLPASAAGGDRILRKPRGFYISERLDRRLDEAVSYLREQHGMRRVDRSVLVTALLDQAAAARL